MGTGRLPLRPSPFWPHAPHPKQGLFLSIPHLEALYGGSAGGGKSVALLMAALQYADLPGYSALLLRKTYPELAQPGGLMDTAHEWLQGQAKWNEQKHRWTFPSGAVVEFGYLHRRHDRFRYQGAEFDFIGLDELTHFDEVDYRYLFSRLRRRAGSVIPPRMRAATNPGGRGHKWVKERFVDQEPTASRAFLPASLFDNPGVDRKSYIRALDEVDAQTRAQLLEGDWNAREPGDWVFDQEGIDAAEMLGREYDLQRLAEEIPPPADDAIQLGIDWGEHVTASVVGWQLERGGLYIPPGELALERTEPARATQRMLDAAASYNWPLDEARYDAAGAQSMRTFAVHAPDSVGIWKVAFSKRKSEAIGYLRQLFERTAQGKTTRVLAISPANQELLRQLRAYALDPLTEKPRKGDDHSVDSLIALVSPIAARHRELVR